MIYTDIFFLIVKLREVLSHARFFFILFIYDKNKFFFYFFTFDLILISLVEDWIENGGVIKRAQRPYAFGQHPGRGETAAGGAKLQAWRLNEWMTCRPLATGAKRK